MQLAYEFALANEPKQLWISRKDRISNNVDQKAAVEVRDSLDEVRLLLIMRHAELKMLTLDAEAAKRGLTEHDEKTGKR